MRYTGIFTLLAALLAAGCTDFEERRVPGDNLPEGTPVKARVSLAVAPELDEQGRAIPLTRAFDELTGPEEEAIRNVWVFQFAEPETAGDEDSRLLLHSTYIGEDKLTAAASTQEVEVDLIDSEGETNLLVFVANVNDGGYGWKMTPGFNTLGDLKTCNYTLRNNVKEDSRLWGDDWRNLIMSGSTEAVVAEGVAVPGVALTRSLAKVCLELTLDNPDYKILSVQMRSLPNTFWFTDAINPPPALDYMLLSLIDYPIEKDIENGLVDNGDTKRIVWYVPPHLRGSNPAVQSVKDKNLYAPRGATHIEIVAKNTVTGDGVLYRVYPGADMTDFNLRANHRYLIEQTVKGNGGVNPADSRIEQFGDETLDGNANSFIINPPVSEGMGPRTFNIPITRVNAYWEPAGQDYPGYGGLNEGIILSTDYWRVDLLWQDGAGMVRAASDPSRTENQMYISKNIGYGPDDYFSITVPAGATHGNFVIAIRELIADSNPIPEYRDADDMVLWSWHFWVTDYNPDRKSMYTVDGGRFVYPVPGGQVERYGGQYWGYDTSGAALSNNWNNYTYNPSSTKAYARSFMMDRTLGALNANHNVYDTQSTLTYQFGRKDPFPGAATLYNIEGIALTDQSPELFKAQRWNTSANSSYNDAKMRMSESIGDPMRFYAVNNNTWALDVDGYSTNTTDGYIWHDARVRMGTSATSVRTYTGKSIFDPCPKGWKIPTVYVWEDFRTNASYGYTISNTSTTAINDRNFPVYTNMLHYWPNIAKDGKHPVEGKIAYQHTDYRYNYNSSYPGNHYGILYGTASYVGRLWSAVPNSNTRGYQGYYVPSASSSFNTSATSSNAYQYRYYGQRIRCVSMEE